MKKIMVIGILAMMAFSMTVLARDVRVDGYYRDNGTYVESYHRSSPDSTRYNNYEYVGNPYSYEKPYRSY